jgi:hypothetical protein
MKRKFKHNVGWSHSEILHTHHPLANWLRNPRSHESSRFWLALLNLEGLLLAFMLHSTKPANDYTLLWYPIWIVNEKKGFIFVTHRFAKVELLTVIVQTIVATYGWSRSDNLQSSPVDNWNIRIRFGVVRLLVRLTGPGLRSYCSCIILIKFLIGRWVTNIKPFFSFTIQIGYQSKV